MLELPSGVPAMTFSLAQLLRFGDFSNRKDRLSGAARLVLNGQLEREMSGAVLVWDVDSSCLAKNFELAAEAAGESLLYVICMWLYNRVRRKKSSSEV
jgi:hypothetical protein